MGNANACQVSNHSKRNVKVFVADKALEIDAFIASQAAGDHSTPPEGKKFKFKSDINCIRVLASQTHEVPWEAHHFLSVFVEDEDDEKICSKQILLNMALSAPITVLLYDPRSHEAVEALFTLDVCAKLGDTVRDVGPSVFFYVTYLLCLCLGPALCAVCELLELTVARWFNWHPVLMVSRLVVLYGIAVVVYRIPFSWKQRKHIWKPVHAGLMLLALFLSVLGLCAVFDFHRGFRIPDLYSLHSWVGICTVVVFAFQWVLGLPGFLFPHSPLWFRSSLKPVHIWIGKAVLILSLTSCISGINEKLLLTLNGITGEPYNSLPVEAKFANSLGILIVAFGSVVFGILSKNKCQRPETDNESVHLLLNEKGM